MLIFQLHLLVPWLLLSFNIFVKAFSVCSEGIVIFITLCLILSSIGRQIVGGDWTLFLVYESSKAGLGTVSNMRPLFSARCFDSIIDCGVHSGFLSFFLARMNASSKLSFFCFWVMGCEVRLYDFRAIGWPQGKGFPFSEVFEVASFVVLFLVFLAWEGLYFVGGDGENRSFHGERL